MTHCKNESQKPLLPYLVILILDSVRPEPKQVRLKGGKGAIWSNVERKKFSNRQEHIWTSKCLLQTKQSFNFRLK